MMENEPPEHTRLRRPVAAAFNRGHVERLRPRVRELAASLLDEVDPDGFDVIAAYAEPLPVLVIAELLGVPALVRARPARLVAGDRADVRGRAVAGDVVDAAVAAATDFAGLVRELVAERGPRPADDLITDLVGHRAHRGRGGRGGRAAAQRRPRGVGQRVRQRPGRDAAARAAARRRRGARRSRRCCASTPRSSCSSAPRPRTSRWAASSSRRARRSRRCSARPTATRRSSTEPDEFDVDRDPNPHLAFGVGVHFCLGAPLARMELVESLTALFDRFPGLALAGEPESRGTFVLRGFRSGARGR